MKRFYISIIVRVSLSAVRVKNLVFKEEIFEQSTGVLSTKITLQYDSSSILNITASIFNCFGSKFCCHAFRICITNNFPAVKVQHRCPVSPSILDGVDIGDICTPLLIDTGGIKISV